MKYNTKSRKQSSALVWANHQKLFGVGRDWYLARSQSTTIDEESRQFAKDLIKKHDNPSTHYY